MIAVLLATARSASAGTWSLSVGQEWTRMQPPDPEDRSHVEFVSRRGATVGIRGDFDLTRTLGLSADLRWVPRGGGVSFRQTYGYFGDYLELSPRLAAKTAGARFWGAASLGPAVAVRVRERNSASLFTGPDVRYPEFGPMSRVELGALVTAGLGIRLAQRTRAWAEVNYNHGLTNMHQPGSAGTFHDPHVYDFRAKSRTIGILVGIGMSLR